MTDAERQVGRIKAIIYACDELTKNSDRYKEGNIAKLIALETAYDHIKGVLDNPAYCPWQE